MTPEEHLALLDGRLDKLSVGRRLITSLGFEPAAVAFAVFDADTGFTPKRPALPFQVGIEPWRADDDGRASPSTLLRGRAVVSNQLNVALPMPSSSFAFTLALPGAGAEELYYRDAVADPQQAAAAAPPAWLVFEPRSPAHGAVRAEMQRIFTLPGTEVPAGQSNVTCTSRVIGHRLTRRDDRYVQPGSGPWTLFRVVEPGDGWVALNLFEGWGEAFAAGRDEAAALFGRHLARAIA